jgi:hypothetical protein
MSWLFDYYANKLDRDFFAELAAGELASVNSVNMSHFDAFISGFPFEAWKSGVHYEYMADDLDKCVRKKD